MGEDVAWEAIKILMADPRICDAVLKIWAAEKDQAVIDEVWMAATEVEGDRRSTIPNLLEHYLYFLAETDKGDHSG